MLLFESKDLIGHRKFPVAYEGMVKGRTPKRESELLIDQCDADIMAMRCIEAQIRLSDFLNEFWDGIKEEDTFSAHLVYELLSGIRFDAKFDEDGIFDLEATEGNESQGVDKS